MSSHNDNPFGLEVPLLTTETAAPTSLEGKIAIVTGAARGIGGNTAALLAARGARVVLADRLVSAGEATASTIRGTGGRALFVTTDVTDADSCQHLMHVAQESFGGLDILVCCAGILRGAYEQVDVLADSTFWQVLDVNVRGTFLCTRFAVPLLRERGGVILLLASGAGVRGPSSSLAYGASKGGVNGFGMTLEAHLAPHGIRVNVICPGSLATTMKLENIADAARAQGLDPAEMVAEARQTGQVADPLGVARVLAFLASDEASFVRGAIFTR